MLTGFLFLFADSGFSQTINKNQSHSSTYLLIEKEKIEVKYNKQYFVSLRDSIVNNNAKDSLIKNKTLDSINKKNENIAKFKMKVK